MRYRVLLLVVLVALVWWSIQFVWVIDRSLRGVAFSPDGSHLACMTRLQFPNSRVEHHLSIIDVATGNRRTLGTIIGVPWRYTRNLILSPKQTADRKMRIWQLVEEKTTFWNALPGFLAVSKSTDLMVVARPWEIQLLRLSTNKFLDRMANDRVKYRLTIASGLPVLVMSPLNHGTLRMFDLSKGRFDEIKSIPDVEGAVWVSDDAKVLAVTRNNVVDVYHVNRAIKTVVEAPPYLATPIVFSPDGCRVAVGSMAGICLREMWTTEDEIIVGERGDIPEDLSSDGKLLAGTDGRGRLKVWDLQNEKQILTCPGVLRSLVRTESCFAVLMFMWAIAWIMSGRGLRHIVSSITDVLLTNGICLGILVSRVVLNSHNPRITSLEVVGIVAFVFGLQSILLVALAMSRLRWSILLPGVVTIFVFGAAILATIWSSEESAQWLALVANLIFVLCLLALLTTWFSFGARWTTLDAAIGIGRLAQQQLPLAHLFLWTTAIAVLIALLRALHPTPISMPTLGKTAIVSSCAAVGIIATAAVVMARKLLLRRIVLLILALAIVAWTARIFAIPFLGGSWTMHFVVSAAFVAVMIVNLLVFRLHGYRIVIDYFELAGR